MRVCLGIILVLALFIFTSPVLETVKEPVYIFKEKIVYKSVYELQRNTGHKPPKDIEIIRNMDNIANAIYAPIIRHFERTYGYIPEVNPNSFKRDWGRGSQHLEGKALDLDIKHDLIFDNRYLYEFIRDSLIYDQLIIYGNINNPSHIHVSYDKERNRKQQYKCYRWRGREWFKEIS